MLKRAKSPRPSRRDHFSLESDVRRTNALGMAKAKAGRKTASALADLVRYCDRTLRTKDVRDYDGAVNGLQVSNAGRVTRIAAAVDASRTTVALALAARADLLIVHHGLFWSARHPWTGRNYELLRLLLDGNLAVYSSHLPLDLHPRLGNNARLAAALGLRGGRPFFLQKQQYLGLQFKGRVARDELGRRLARILGAAPIVLPGGPAVCQRIGVVTGGAGAELRQAVDEGVDTFVTGEGPHWTFPLAEELGVNVFYGGHYATETFGVKALSADLAERFGVPWTFLDHPSGL
jgi:dinuclear metal center YbgI/SA1388 family protein